MPESGRNPEQSDLHNRTSSLPKRLRGKKQAMVMPLQCRNALIVALGAVAVACASSAKSPTVTSAPPSKTTMQTSAPTAAPTAQAPDAETELARSMLLALADFPAGSVEKPRSSPVADDPVAACQALRPGSTGYADTAEFSRGAAASDIEERVYIFPSAQDALAWLPQYKAGLDCFVGGINAGKLDLNGLTFRDAAIESISFASPPDTTLVGYRVTFRGGRVGGTPVDVTIDSTAVIVDRVAFTIDGGPFGYSSDELTPYLSRAASKTEAQLR